MSKAIIFGGGSIAELTHYYLTHDSPHEVAAFTVDGAYIKADTVNGLPVVAFEDVESAFPPDSHQMFVALGYSKLNRLRADKCEEAEAKGYRLLSYVSSKASVWPDLDIGANSMICENCIIQPYATIGNDVIVSPGAMIGHHSRVHDHCFVGSAATVLGMCVLEASAILAAGALVTDGVIVRQECIIGAGAVITKDTKAQEVYLSQPSTLVRKNSRDFAPFLTWRGELTPPR